MVMRFTGKSGEAATRTPASRPSLAASSRVLSSTHCVLIHPLDLPPAPHRRTRRVHDARPRGTRYTAASFSYLHTSQPGARYTRPWGAGWERSASGVMPHRTTHRRTSHVRTAGAVCIVYSAHDTLLLRVDIYCVKRIEFYRIGEPKAKRTSGIRLMCDDRQEGWTHSTHSRQAKKRSRASLSLVLLRFTQSAPPHRNGLISQRTTRPFQ